MILSALRTANTRRFWSTDGNLCVTDFAPDSAVTSLEKLFNQLSDNRKIMTAIKLGTSNEKKKSVYSCVF